jgi:hypothetical protein
LGVSLEKDMPIKILLPSIILNFYCQQILLQIDTKFL